MYQWGFLQIVQGRVIKRNIIYYDKYPQDVKRVIDFFSRSSFFWIVVNLKVRTIVAYLESNQITLPSGGLLTPSRLQQLGMSFGLHGRIISLYRWVDPFFLIIMHYMWYRWSSSWVHPLLTLPVPFTNIHIILELVFRAFNDLELFNKLSYKTLQLIEQSQSFDGNPIYAILHEPIYCQGYVLFDKIVTKSFNKRRSRAANWSASRILQKYEQFSWSQVKVQGDSTPLFFTGEMVAFLFVISLGLRWLFFLSLRSSLVCLMITPIYDRGKAPQRYSRKMILGVPSMILSSYQRMKWKYLL